MKAENKFLFKLYQLAPSRLKGLIQHQIVRREGGQMYSMTLRAIYRRLYGIEVGYGSYGGCFSRKNVPRGVVFGNYCSIAPEIRIFRANHPKDTFTSHPLLYNPVAGFVEKDMLERAPLKVGNDVWIGEWAIILPRVSVIGNGAMVGAGSVVTKDVPPYAIVAGNPAKIIGYRFDEITIQKLEESKWWERNRFDLEKEINELQKITST
ncbi:MAG: CatB-related O-acetyltransferase [Pseudosphingobacterium sp.]|nr:CatB-related O-acetyltransferase [Olivibacter sp. UJ_SKK_5.1]MDX3912682.1 CatB-related O-acetyltransferase [Pseudosphingobacterium sp.]